MKVFGGRWRIGSVEREDRQTGQGPRAGNRKRQASGPDLEKPSSNPGITVLADRARDVLLPIFGPHGNYW